MTPAQATSTVEPTQRQLIAWVDNGWLHPARTGRGNPWTWPPQEWDIACLMARLAHAGIHHNFAADIARIGVTLGGPVTLAPGLVLHIDDPGERRPAPPSP